MLSVLSDLIHTLIPAWRETGRITYKPPSWNRAVLFSTSALTGNHGQTTAVVGWGMVSTWPDSIWRQVPSSCSVRALRKLTEKWLGEGCTPAPSPTSNEGLQSSSLRLPSQSGSPLSACKIWGKVNHALYFHFLTCKTGVIRRTTS